MTPSSRDLTWQQVHWPIPVSSQQALELLRRLASDMTRQPVVWETRATEGSIVYLIGTAAHQVREISDTIKTAIPGMMFSPVNGLRPEIGRVARLEIRGQLLRLAVDRAPQTARTILGALAIARFHEEQAVLQVILGRSRRPLLVGSTPPDPTQPWFDLMTHGPRQASHEVRARLRDKASEPGFNTVVRVSAVAHSEARQQAIMRGLVAAVQSLQAPGTRMTFAKDTGPALNDARPPRLLSLHLAASEALSLLAWPLEADDLPGLPSAHPKLLPLSATTFEKDRVFAATSSPGPTKPLGISIKDALFHTLAIGPTGVGKSTMLLNLIVHDMSAGRSVVVIDAKSDLIHDVLQRVPEHRPDDVVVLNPMDDRPVGLNPLRADRTEPELIADSILGIFRDLYPSAFGPRTNDVLHAAILTLALNPGATLAWLPRLLTDTRFRAGLIGHLDDPDGLESFWAQYSALSDRQQAQFTAPVLSRLRQFLLRPGLKRVLDQSEPKFKLGDVFTKTPILLVPLNAGLLGGDSAKLLGSLLVSQLWQLTLARASVPQAKRSPVSIYIDELQEFVRLGGDDLADGLARSRSLGVAWHLAHQYRDQLSPDMRAALDANTRNKIVFTVGAKDARDMAQMAPELTAEDFMSLPKYGIYAHLMRGGEQLGWVSGKTLPPPPVTSNPVRIIAASRERYGADPSEPRPASPTTTSRERPDDPIGRRPRASQ